MTDRESWCKDLSRRLQSTHRPAPVRHVSERIAVLLHGDELVLTDNGLAQEGDDLTGRITVFSKRVVAVADVQGVTSLLQQGRRELAHRGPARSRQLRAFCSGKGFGTWASTELSGWYRPPTTGCQ